MKDKHQKAAEEGALLIPTEMNTPEAQAAWLRLTYFPELTRELKQEWRDVAKHCKQRRKDAWDERFEKKGDLQPDMTLPRLATMELERRFGPSWMSDKKAMKWASKEWPQFKVK